ncbi:MAG: hypothetical protein HQL08_15590, partial [Nitrospirae bacterium]|nr:hypothetical protein [Nitrospirota bacterium]
MKARTFTALISLVSIMCALTACGSSGSSGPAASTSEALTKNALVTVAVDPNIFSKKAKKISSSTNYIQLYVTQWQAGDLNALAVINTATDTLTAANAAATLTLYPTYTRICASQYSGTPAAGTAPTEASCSFGTLNSGNNTVTLTMLAGTWTLSAIYNGFSSLTLGYPNSSTSSSGTVSYGVYDGSVSGGNGGNNSAPAQGVNNWGSYYQAQFNNSSGNGVTGLSKTFSLATTFFNYGDNGPSFASYAKAQTAPGTKNNVNTETFIGGFGKGVDSDGWIREAKSIIWYPLKSNSPV